MPRPFPVEFRLRAFALVRAGKPLTAAAHQLGVSATALHNWVRQDQIERGERSGTTSPESVEMAKAQKHIRQLETEVEILTRVRR
jgi:transposase